jgi:hypothetical protein
LLEWCCLCKNCGESIDNLFLQCEVAIEVECVFTAFWCCVDYVSQGERVVGKSEGTTGQLFGVAYMEDGSFVFDMMALARVECTKF